METTPKHTSDVFKITGDWTAQSKTLKANYPQLTDADLKLESGKDLELLTRVETRLHKKRDEVINIIKKGMPTKV